MNNQNPIRRRSAGSTYLGDNRCTFTVWAPEKRAMQLHLVHPAERILDMETVGHGYFQLTVPDVPPGSRYFFRPDGERDFPDPAAASQPSGVHGPSEVVDHNAFRWEDKQWCGRPFGELILYELHVGTFTPEGTFDAIIPRLPALVETGINAIELMPVAQFPGDRNWGYDGAYLYAVQNSYGGPEGLKRLVDACHAQGISVFLDVVYNHFGPEGNYLSVYGPYFTHKYGTPWGDAVNFDGEWSDGVREFVVENMVYWFREYHIDGLRLDAIHAIFDIGAVSVWELAHERVRALERELGRPLYLVAESDLNSPRVVKDPESGGYGFNAQWLDDFHHALYVLLDPKGRERYEDFGSLAQLAKAFNEGFVHSGEYVSFRKRRYGASSQGIPGDRFVVFNHNHDQVGNRVRGERLSMLVDFRRQLLGAAVLLVSPYVPMLFMGEEYADNSPFYYFVSHSDPDLIRAVREGRKKEFEKFLWDTEPPDPQDETTFQSSKLRWEDRDKGAHARMLAWHTALIGLRRSHPALRNFNKDDIRVEVMGQNGLLVQRRDEQGLRSLVALFNFSEEVLPVVLPEGAESWRLLLDSRASSWQPEMSGDEHPGTISPRQTLQLAPWSAVLYDGGAEGTAGK